MIKKTITYEDYMGNERTEDFYFNLSKAELTEMELGIDGGFSAMIERITKAKDTPSIVKVFKELLLKSVGIKSPDGRRFIKSDQIREEFEQTEAYSQLFMSLATDEKEASEFVNGVIPKSLGKEIDKQAGASNTDIRVVDSSAKVINNT